MGSWGSSLACALVVGAALLPAEAAAAATPEGEPRVTIAMLPRGETLTSIARKSPQLAPGVLSAGLGSVPSDQTYLDVSQGNRVFGSLYPASIPPLPIRDSRVPKRFWKAELRRATKAPADLLPGLLASRLRGAGIDARARPDARESALLAVRPDGTVGRARRCELGRCPGLTVARVDVAALRRLVRGLEGDDMLIALERPPPLERLLAVGIAGRGFDGELRSDTTRIDGYVTATDLAPTILERFGLRAPEEMIGNVITSTGERDVAALASLQRRLSEVASRRHPVLGVNVVIWVGLVLVAIAFYRARAARVALPALAVTIAWVPALLLLTAALEPSLLAERLIVGLGGPGIALATLRALRPPFGERAPFAAFALAASVSVLATAVDILAGSPLTALSLLGPNPALGVRFFGIGNELEAVVGVLLTLGAGAAVAAARPDDPRRSVAIVASIAALAGVAVFAPGRLGADVGAAITFPAGAAGVVIAALGAGRRRLIAVVAAPLIAVGGLIAVDLAIGGDAHLSRSVLDAGGLDELGQVVERRVRLGAASFTRFFGSFFFLAALVGIVAGVVRRERILGWFSNRPAVRAGFIGGIVAAVVGSLANDSGALLLMVAMAYLSAYAGLVWATSGTAEAEPP